MYRMERSPCLLSALSPTSHTEWRVTLCCLLALFSTHDSHILARIFTKLSVAQSTSLNPSASQARNSAQLSGTKIMADNSTNNSTDRSTDNATTIVPESFTTGPLDYDGPLPACQGYECACTGLPTFHGSPTFHCFIPRNTRCAQCFSLCSGNRIFVGAEIPGSPHHSTRCLVDIECRHCPSKMIFRLNSTSRDYQAEYRCYHDFRDQNVRSAGNIAARAGNLYERDTPQAHAARRAMEWVPPARQNRITASRARLQLHAQAPNLFQPSYPPYPQPAFTAGEDGAQTGSLYPYRGDT
jgi:hypothetical protein